MPWTKIREEIRDEYKQASRADRKILLATYKAVMDRVERHICPADLETFRTARRQDYNLPLVSECIIGGGDVSPETLEAVTHREVAADRMAADARPYRRQISRSPKASSRLAPALCPSAGLTYRASMLAKVEGLGRR